MGEQAAQMFLAQSVGFLIESFVTEGDVSSGESFEQFADAGLAEPGEVLSGRWAAQSAASSFAARSMSCALASPLECFYEWPKSTLCEVFPQASGSFRR